MASIVLFSTPDRIRTCDPLLRRQMLYPTELRAHVNYIDKFKGKSFAKKMKSSIHEDIVPKVVLDDIQKILIVSQHHLFCYHFAV